MTILFILFEISVILFCEILFFPNSMINCILISRYGKDYFDVLLSFKEFKTYYYLNPDRYSFKDEFIKTIDLHYHRIPYMDTGLNGPIKIGFNSALDYYKFYTWVELELNSRKTIKREKLQNKHKEELLLQVQKDIDMLKAESNKDFETANNIMDSITQRK